MACLSMLRGGRMMGTLAPIASPTVHHREDGQ
jgi:hypothetical protein